MAEHLNYLVLRNVCMYGTNYCEWVHELDSAKFLIQNSLNVGVSTHEITD